MSPFKKLYFSLFSLGLILSTSLLATPSEIREVPRKNNSAFIAKKDTVIIMEIGNSKKRHAPYSTFKVALTLMGFDKKILENKDSPKWAFREDYEKNFQAWYTREKGMQYNWCQDHTPATFMKNSVLWFSHQITQRLGLEVFQDYIVKLNYGNKDVSGTPDKNDSLFNSWLGTSLEISPYEQVAFLEKLLSKKLDVSKDAQEKTMEIMDREEDWNGWKLYGKTGGGTGNQGWFIGWIEKEDGQRIVFAQYLDLDDSDLDLTGIILQKTLGLTAKEIIKRNIMQWLQAQKNTSKL